MIQTCFSRCLCRYDALATNRDAQLWPRDAGFPRTRDAVRCPSPSSSTSPTTSPSNAVSLLLVLSVFLSFCLTLVSSGRRRRRLLSTPPCPPLSPSLLPPQRFASKLALPTPSFSVLWASLYVFISPLSHVSSRLSKPSFLYVSYTPSLPPLSLTQPRVQRAYIYIYIIFCFFSSLSLFLLPLRFPRSTHSFYIQWNKLHFRESVWIYKQGGFYSFIYSFFFIFTGKLNAVIWVHLSREWIQKIWSLMGIV